MFTAESAARHILIVQIEMYGEIRMAEIKEDLPMYAKATGISETSLQGSIEAQAGGIASDAGVEIR